VPEANEAGMTESFENDAGSGPDIKENVKARSTWLRLVFMILFAVIFYWTPPHFWALALFKRGDYERARVPMFPEIYGDAETRRHILLYTVMLVVVSILPFALQYMGVFYLACALVLGGFFLLRTWQLSTNPSDHAARRVFFFSLIYLAVIFLAMVIDRMVWFS
jgi:heme o synthase